jgi:hypothetical protein
MHAYGSNDFPRDHICFYPGWGGIYLPAHRSREGRGNLKQFLSVGLQKSLSCVTKILIIEVFETRNLIRRATKGKTFGGGMLRDPTSKNSLDKAGFEKKWKPAKE